MVIARNVRIAPSFFVLVPFLTVITCIIVGIMPRVTSAESPADAIARIRGGPHAQMPSPQEAYASGGSGKGMTIENGTGYLLRVHFSGPVIHTVGVPDGQSADVELVVGSYELAAEVPDAPIMPFYGRQTYKSNMHYWLKFFVETRFQ